jgi:class 3 adenylate cyclase
MRARSVHLYDGYVVQSTGDGIFALFGAPVAHEDHPQRAVHAALAARDDLRRRSKDFQSNGRTSLGPTAVKGIAEPIEIYEVVLATSRIR